MRKKLLLIIVFCISCCLYNEAVISQGVRFPQLYVIESIILKGNAYIIDAESNKRKFRILSEKEIVKNPNRPDIQVGDTCLLTLKLFYPHPSWGENSLVREIHAVDYNGTSIYLRGFGDSLFVTDNLRGLRIYRD